MAKDSGNISGSEILKTREPPFKYDIRVTGDLFANKSDNATSTKVSVKILGNEDGDIVVEQQDSSSLASPSPSVDGEPRIPQFTSKRAADGGLELHIHALPIRPKTAAPTIPTTINGGGSGGGPDAPAKLKAPRSFVNTPVTRASTRLSEYAQSRPDSSGQSFMEIRPAFEEDSAASCGGDSQRDFGAQTPQSLDLSESPVLVGGGAGGSIKKADAIDDAASRPRSASMSVTMEDKCTMTTWRGIPGDLRPEYASRASAAASIADVDASSEYLSDSGKQSRASTVLRGGGAQRPSDNADVLSVFNGPPVAPAESRISSRASARPRSLPREVNKYKQLPPRKSQKDKINYREAAERLLTQYFAEEVLQRYLDELRRRYRFMGKGGMTPSEITQLLDETTADSDLKEQLRASLEELVNAPLTESMSDCEHTDTSSQRHYLSIRGTELRNVLDRTSVSPAPKSIRSHAPSSILVGGGMSMDDLPSPSTRGYNTIRSDQMSVAASVLPAESVREGLAESIGHKSPRLKPQSKAAPSPMPPSRSSTPATLKKQSEKPATPEPQPQPQSYSRPQSQSRRDSPMPSESHRSFTPRAKADARAGANAESGAGAQKQADGGQGPSAKQGSADARKLDPKYWDDDEKYKMRPPDMKQAFSILKSQPIYVREMSSSDIKFKSPFSKQHPAPPGSSASDASAKSPPKASSPPPRRGSFTKRHPTESKVAKAVSELEEVLRRTEAETLASIDNDFNGPASSARCTSPSAASHCCSQCTGGNINDTESVVSHDSLIGGGASSRSASVATRISAVGTKYDNLRPESASKLSASQSTIRTDILLKEGIEFGDADRIDEEATTVDESADDEREDEGEDAVEEEEEAAVPVEHELANESTVSLPMNIEDMSPELAAVLLRTGGLDNDRIRRMTTPTTMSSVASSKVSAAARSEQRVPSQASHLSRASHATRASSASQASQASQASRVSGTSKVSQASHVSKSSQASQASRASQTSQASKSTHVSRATATSSASAAKSTAAAAAPANASVRSAAAASAAGSSGSGARSLTELDIVMKRTAGILSRASAASRMSTGSSSSVLRGGSGTPSTPGSTRDLDNELANVLRRTSGYAPSSISSYSPSLASNSRPVSVVGNVDAIASPEPIRPASGATSARSSHGQAAPVNPREQPRSPPPPASAARSPILRAVRSPVAQPVGASNGYAASPLRKADYQSSPRASPVPSHKAASSARYQQAAPPQQQQQQQQDDQSDRAPSPFMPRIPTPVFGRFPSPPPHIKNRGRQPTEEEDEEQQQQQPQQSRPAQYASDQEDPSSQMSNRGSARGRAQSQSAHVESERTPTRQQYEEEPVIERLDLETGSLASRRGRARTGSEFGSASTLMNLNTRGNYDLPKVVEEDVDSLASYPSSRHQPSPNLVGGGRLHPSERSAQPQQQPEPSTLRGGGRLHPAFEVPSPSPRACDAGCCGVCGQGVSKSDIVVRPQVMHASCLRCEACDCLLTSSTFRAIDGHVYCESDYQRFFTRGKESAKAVAVRPGMTEKQFQQMNRAIMESFTSVDDFLKHMRQLRQAGDQSASNTGLPYAGDPSAVQRAGDLGVDRQTHYEREQVTSPSGTPWITERVVDKKVKTKVLEKRYPAAATAVAEASAGSSAVTEPTLVGGGAARPSSNVSRMDAMRKSNTSSASRPTTSLLNDTKPVNGWDHPLCPGCNHVVYLNDRVVHEGYGYHKACMRCRQCAQVIPATTAIRIKGALYCKKHGTELLRRRSILMRKKSTMGRRSRNSKHRAGVSVERFAAGDENASEQQRQAKSERPPPLPQMPMFSGANNSKLPVPPAIGGVGSKGSPRRVTTALRNFLEAAAEQIENQSFLPIPSDPPSARSSATRSPAPASASANPEIVSPKPRRPLPQPKPKAKPASVPPPATAKSPAPASRPGSRSIFAGSRESFYDANVVNALRQEAQRQINGSQTSIVSPESPVEKTCRLLSPCGPSIADALQKYAAGGRDGRVSVSSQFDPFVEASQDPLNGPASPMGKQAPAFAPNAHLDNLERRFRNANFRPPWALKSSTMFE
ncbi:hypothetical protein LPJ56_000711 [Coemansia sp. RSA 2599]|nr:hypothetical protein LPJ75_000369 [Coemansia sp. RSA 2598]KAJ1829020.1 hypothetical protein LPJ56_000711 [Coemansia sp. RSA 2599]